jgi:hypothetical protein
MDCLGKYKIFCVKKSMRGCLKRFLVVCISNKEGFVKMCKHLKFHLTFYLF